MTKKHIYIVPAFSEIGGQCRIVACDGDCKSPRDAYQADPQSWKEIGLMNSRGSLVYLDASEEIFGEIKSCEPLMAGATFYFE